MLPINSPFALTTTEKANQVGAVLLFDEVMTSRMSGGGLQNC
jgi:glutamate-1-semialdehyde aminotransferase